MANHPIGSNNQRILHSNISSWELRDLTKARALFPEQELTVLDSQGLTTHVRKVVYQAACSHFLYGPEDLAGLCQICSGTICGRCVIRCRTCFKMLCPEHIRMQDGQIFCPTCSLTNRFKRIGGRAIKSVHSELSRKD